MRDDQRTRVWIDEFQTRMTRRIIAYLALSLVVTINLVYAWRLLTEGVTDPAGQLVGVLRDHLPVIVCLVVLAPVMAWDAIRFTHRLVGPLVRFRRAMQAIARGEAVADIRLRDGDQLDALRDDFNEMLDALRQRGAVPAPPAQGEAAVGPVALAAPVGLPQEGKR
jgi:methyl-accepting chemotaxis protein